MAIQSEIIALYESSSILVNPLRFFNQDQHPTPKYNILFLKDGCGKYLLLANDGYDGVTTLSLYHYELNVKMQNEQTEIADIS
jgi:hypothetical protein